MSARWRRARGSVGLVPVRRGVGEGRRRQLGERAVGIGGGADAAALLADDGGDAGGEVAEVVGEVGVVAADEAFVA